MFTCLWSFYMDNKSPVDYSNPWLAVDQMHNVMKSDCTDPHYSAEVKRIIDQMDKELPVVTSGRPIMLWAKMLP